MSDTSNGCLAAVLLIILAVEGRVGRIAPTLLLRCVAAGLMLRRIIAGTAGGGGLVGWLVVSLLRFRGRLAS